MELLLSIGFSITGFTLFLLLRKREHKLVHKFALAILTLWFLRFVLFYLKAEVDLTNIPWLYFIDQNLFFLDGVFLYWFSKSLNKKKFRFVKESTHLIPFVIAVLLTTCLFFTYTSTQLNEIYQTVESQIKSQSYTPPIEEIIFIVAVLIQNVVYLFFGYKKISQYNQYILSNYSTIDKVKIKWLPKFFTIWLLLLVLPLIIYFINYISPIIDLKLIQPIVLLSLTTAAVYFSVHIINQYYANFTLTKTKIKVNLQEVNQEELKMHYLKLQELMNAEKLYLNEDLTLGILSEQMDLNPAKLSTVIKTQTNGNFYDYINGFRIERIKEELITSDEQIIIIAYSNGFSSKSTFNKVFKTITGQSPSQFRKQNKS